MPVFTYTASSPNGGAVSGSERARTLGEARRRVSARGFHSVLIRERTRRWNVAVTAERIGRERVRQLLQQLTVFVRAGLPLLDALGILADETDDRLVRRTVLELMEDLRSGTSLASAMAGHPELLLPHHIGMIRAAEASGHLGVALADIEHDIARSLEMRSAIRSSATYPLVVLSLACITVVVLAVVVLPRFRTLFDDLSTDPPLVTRLLLGALDGLLSIPVSVWAAALSVIATLVVLGLRPGARGTRDRFLLHAPIVGTVARLSTLERLCRVLSISLRSGVTLPDALVVSGEAVGNVVVQRRIAVARERVLAGQGLAQTLGDLDVVTPAIRQMIAVGEATGTVVHQLELAAQHLQDHVTRRITRLTSLLEPAMILIVGLVVGFVAIALVSAMYGVIGDIGTDVP